MRGGACLSPLWLVHALSQYHFHDRSCSMPSFTLIKLLSTIGLNLKKSRVKRLQNFMATKSSVYMIWGGWFSYWHLYIKGPFHAPKALINTHLSRSHELDYIEEVWTLLGGEPNPHPPCYSIAVFISYKKFRPWTPYTTFVPPRKESVKGTLVYKQFPWKH